MEPVVVGQEEIASRSCRSCQLNCIRRLNRSIDPNSRESFRGLFRKRQHGDSPSPEDLPVTLRENEVAVAKRSDKNLPNAHR